MTHGQDTARRLDTFLGDDHCPVMQRGILEKDVLYKPLVDVRVDHVTCRHDVIQRHITLNDDQRSHFPTTHIHRRHHYRHDNLLDIPPLFLLTPRESEEPQERADSLMGTQIVEELTDILLEQHDQGDDTHTDQLVENRAKQSHLQHLRHEKPDDDEHHNTREHVQRARVAHQPIDVVEHQCYQQDVDDIFQSKLKKHNYLTI